MDAEDHEAIEAYQKFVVHGPLWEDEGYMCDIDGWPRDSHDNPVDSCDLVEYLADRNRSADLNTYVTIPDGLHVDGHWISGPLGVACYYDVSENKMMVIIYDEV